MKTHQSRHVCFSAAPLDVTLSSIYKLSFAKQKKKKIWTKKKKKELTL